MRRKVSTTVYLEVDVLDELKEVSQRTRVPMAVMIRQAIEEYLEKPRPSVGRSRPAGVES